MEKLSHHQHHIKFGVSEPPTYLYIGFEQKPDSSSLNTIREFAKVISEQACFTHETDGSYTVSLPTLNTEVGTDKKSHEYLVEKLGRLISMSGLGEVMVHDPYLRQVKGGSLFQDYQS